MTYANKQAIDAVVEKLEFYNDDCAIGFKAGLTWMTLYADIDHFSEVFDDLMKLDLENRSEEIARDEIMNPVERSKFGTDLAMTLLREDDPKSAAKFWEFHFGMSDEEIGDARESMLFYLGFFKALQEVWPVTKRMLQE